MVTELQKANVPIVRAAKAFESEGRKFAPGTFVIPPTPAAQKIVDKGGRSVRHPGVCHVARAGRWTASA